MALRLSVDPSAPPDRVLVLAAEVIQAGGVVVYPTDTLYGLGADARNDAAVRRVQALKRRDEDRPVLVLVHGVEAARALTGELTPEASRLAAAFWPGPLTLICRARVPLPRGVTGGTGKIGVRVPASPFCVRLSELAGCPLTSTSANISGEPAARTIRDIEAALGAGVDLFVDGGVLRQSVPSTVVDAAERPPRLVREGVIPRAELQKIVPQLLG